MRNLISIILVISIIVGCNTQSNKDSKEDLANMASKEDHIIGTLIPASHDPTMAKVCSGSSCEAKNYDESLVVEQPGSKMRDFVKCPVSGVVFKITKNHPKLTYAGYDYYTCCKGCANKFKELPDKFIYL